ncbi:MAG: radical SAM protein [Myxococcales bacterium]|nr:radical SAM protein [Myxococcales bacterium]MCB9716665.1 radical SAM protein [Myxococcales bacterium]
MPSADDWDAARPVYVVWELTLACDQRCGHCGSRAGRPRERELDREECLCVVAQLAALGTREITLIGGEAYLHRAWLDVIRSIVEHGMLCTLQTGGRRLSEERLDAAIDAGLGALGVSIDGPEAIHDALRGVQGSAAIAWWLLERARARGLPTTVNTTVTPAAMPHLDSMLESIVAAEVRTWQIGINVAMGRAADGLGGLLQPYDLLELVPTLARLAEAGRERGVTLMPGNTVGYFGPHETLLRHAGDGKRHWTGCSAGRNGMGIESDGTIKACPSLPREDYAAGSVRDGPIAGMWSHDATRYLRTRTVEDLWGFCRSCVHAADCLAGCSWVSHSFMGRPGNNPYCHHRALELRARGLRERVEHVAAPPGRPFDLGRFALWLEPIDGQGEAVLQVPPAWERPSTAERAERALPRRLVPCPACGRHSPGEDGRCGACGYDLAEADAERSARLRRARRALVRLRVLMDDARLDAGASRPGDGA